MEMITSICVTCFSGCVVKEVSYTSVIWSQMQTLAYVDLRDTSLGTLPVDYRLATRGRLIEVLLCVVRVNVQYIIYVHKPTFIRKNTLMC